VSPLTPIRYCVDSSVRPSARHDALTAARRGRTDAPVREIA